MMPEHCSRTQGSILEVHDHLACPAPVYGDTCLCGMPTMDRIPVHSHAPQLVASSAGDKAWAAA